MGFHRRILPAEVPSPRDLTADMAGIGMNIAADPDAAANIEDTLLHASVEGMERGDLRVLSILVTWLGVHGDRVNAGRLVRITGAQESGRVRAFWSAVGRWLGRDRRLARLQGLHRGRRVDLLPAGTDFQVGRRGEDPRFAGSRLRVPAGVLRDRRADVLSPPDLARRHPAYRWRLAIGPTWRADMWAVLEGEPLLAAADLARRTYGSFATAWQVKRDRESWSPGEGTGGRPAG